VILVICATEQERAHLAAREGVEFLVCGIGPVEAAIATAGALARAPYALVINAGIAGVFPGRGEVGDAFAVAEAVYADLELEGGAALPFALPNRAESSAAALAPFRDGRVAARLGRTTARVGRGLTTATITASDSRAALLAQRFDCDLEAMEGFAVLRAAARAGVPALEVRGISNVVGNRATNRWDFKRGAQAAAAVLEAFLDTFEAER
jgi:futalosine hydrolase